MTVIRWKAVWPLSVTGALMAVAWWLFLDPAVQWGVEDVGTRIVGAKVDLRDADVRLASGVVALRGLQVTDPDAPMTNLFEADAIVVNVQVAPLLERKVIVDTVAVRGLRFGTPRETSGALPERSPGSGAALRVARDFAGRVRVPPLELATLTRAVNVQAISPESLATLRAARAVEAFADTARAQLLASLHQLHPAPTIDSARALVARLEQASLRTLGLTGARQAVTDTRRTITQLTQLDDRLRGLQADVQGDAAGLTARVNAIAAARTADFAYARSLLQIPSLDAPALGPQLFSAPIAERLSEVVYWLEQAERWVPPGIERRFRQGPDRVRASGTDVVFPRETDYPAFLLRVAELSMTLGGQNLATGQYAARLTGLTSQPSVYGQPATFLLARAQGTTGPSDIRITGLMDHVTGRVRDTIGARLVGVTLPTLPLPGLGATVRLGAGTTALMIDRRGDSLSGRWLWRATRVSWTRDSTALSASPPVRLVSDAIWRAVSRLDSVEIEARFTGTLSNPSFAINTNIASAVARALRDQLGAEIQRAETEVRNRVNALVDQQAAEARARADAVKADVDAQIAAQRTRLEETKAALEARLRELVRIPGVS